MTESRDFPAYLYEATSARQTADSIGFIVGGLYKAASEYVTEEVAADLARELGKALIKYWVQG